MIRRIATSLSLAAALFLNVAAVQVGAPARAQSCLSQDQVRAAVDSGAAISLSDVVGQIRAQVGGEILSSPMLCDYGGRLVYVVNVLSDGQVTRLNVDAQTGAISY
jgi:uncharacterized membrane protein YkoI